MTPLKTKESSTFAEYNGLVYEIIKTVYSSTFNDTFRFQCNGTFTDTEKEIKLAINEMMTNP